jgi:aspartokinase-like uncharacterized kinase
MAPDLVAKVGGSLHNLPRLGEWLRAWLDEQRRERVLLIPGGGLAADWIRDLDAHDHLGAERAHWLALRALTFAAHVLMQRLPTSCVVDCLEACQTAWHRGHVPILDMHAFALADEARPGHLEHSWAVTSDSLAARVAVVARCPHLVLLKSRDLGNPCDWSEAVRQGWVDAAFPAVLAGAASLRVTAIHFRAWRSAASTEANAPRIAP